MSLATSRTKSRAGTLALLLAAAVIIASPAAYGQIGKGAITGRAVDSTGAPLKGAKVVLQPADFSAATDDRGEFIIQNIVPGAYTVVVSYVGFEPFTSTVTVAAGQTARVDASLKVASKNEQIIVTADAARGDAEAVNRERTSDTISQVITSDVITSLPNANIADAVGRLPGVSLERDEGEGKYIQIRGTEPRLNNVTLDGINVPSPEADVRQVKLDSIPADLVESIEINKTLSANMDGDGIGGSVNLVTKTAGDQPTISLNGLGGYTPIIGGRYMDQFDGTIGKRFGADKRFGVLFGGSYDFNGRGIDDIEPGIDSGFAAPTYDSIDLREYRYDRTRYGFAGSSDYKLGEGSGLYLRGLYSDFKDYGDKWVYTLNSGDVPEFGTSSRRPDFGIASLTLGGKHLFSSSWFSWEVAASRSRQLYAAGDPKATFDPIPGTPLSNLTNCVFDPAATTDKFRPQFSPNCTAAGSPVYDPTQYELTALAVTSQGLTAQLNLQAGASYGKTYHIGSTTGILEVGGKVRNGHKFQNATEDDYVPSDTAPAIAMSQFLDSFTNPNYYNNSYRYGPVTNYNQIVSFFNTNPGDFTLDVSDSHLNTDPNNFGLIERVSAGYVMNTFQFSRFRIQFGVRFEGTQLDINGNVVTNDVNGDWVSTAPNTSDASYLSVLPSVSIQYAIGKNTDIRAVYGRGIARPDPFDLVPFVQQDFSQNPPAINIGNPDLKPEYANNYDVLFEHYLLPFGKITGGFFFKQLSDPIYEFVSLPTTGEFAGDQVFQLRNGSNGHLWGFEIAYLQRMTFLPGFLSGFGISANYTWTDSRAYNLPGRPDTPALQRQAPNLWNVSPTYDRGRVSIRAGLSYNGPSIFAYQYQSGGSPDFGPHGPAGDQYLYTHFQVDAQAAIRVAPGLQFIFSGLNLTNSVFGFYNGSQQYVAQREFYKPTYEVGLRWNPSFEK